MNLTRNQVDTLSKYLGDLSKLLFASTVLGFFVPIGTSAPTPYTFLIGSAATLASLWISVKLAE